jgi:hypothetical protein
MKTPRGFDALRRQAFKNCIRFNFSKLASFYDAEDKAIAESAKQQATEVKPNNEIENKVLAELKGLAK